MKIIDKKQPIKASDLLHYNTPKMRNNKDTNPKEKAKIHRHPKQRNTVQKLYALPFPTKIHTTKKEKAERTDRSVFSKMCCTMTISYAPISKPITVAATPKIIRPARTRQKTLTLRDGPLFSCLFLFISILLMKIISLHLRKGQEAVR